MESLTRREFLRTVVVTVAAIAAARLSGMDFAEAVEQPLAKLAESIPTTVLGRTGWKSKIIGLGTIFRADWEGRTMTPQEAEYLITTLLDAGINLIELGVVYGSTENHTSSEEWVGRVLPKRRRDQVFISSKSTKITKEGFLRDVEGSLARLHTDHVDNYMLHNYSTFVEYERAMGPDGAFEGLLQAQKEGKTRFIGITSHGCQVIMNAMRSGKFDVFLLPYNAASREFSRALDLAAQLNVGQLIMKPYGGAGLLRFNEKDSMQLPVTLTPSECLRYVLSHPGAKVAVPNMGNLQQLREGLAAVATFKPLTAEERAAIEAKADRINGGICSECAKPCDGACPSHVPVSTIMSNAQMMRRLGYDNRRAGDMYAALPHDFQDCDGCGSCEKMCPKQFAIRNELEKYDMAYRESRYRTVLQFEKTYR